MAQACGADERSELPAYVAWRLRRVPERVVVTARAFWDNGEAAEAMLTAAGIEVAHSFEAGPPGAGPHRLDE